MELYNGNIVTQPSYNNHSKGKVCPYCEVDPQSGTQVWGQGYKNLKSVFWGEMFSWKVSNYINYLKYNLLFIKLKVWCRRGDSNSHSITETSP